MYSAHGLTEETDTHADFSFRALDGWKAMYDGVLTVNIALAGDALKGPSFGLTAYKPAGFPPGPNHAHASDSLRVVVKGGHTTGRKVYGPGEFRFQKGWGNYAGEGYDEDAPDSWVLIMTGDRRGVRIRFADEELVSNGTQATFNAASRELHEYFGIEVEDTISDDPEHTAGPSAVATTIGPLSNSGKIDGSFAARESWDAVGTGIQAVVALMGDPEVGPVVVLSATEPNQVATARCRFDTETVRMIVRGSCTIDGHTYEPGDLRIQRPGEWCEETIAGPDGLDEVFVVADRRHADPTMDGSEAWPARVGEKARDLTAELPEPAAA